MSAAGCCWCRSSPSPPTPRAATGRALPDVRSACSLSRLRERAGVREREKCPGTSVRVLTRGLDHRTPLRDLGFDELLVLGRCQAPIGDDDGPEGFFALDEFGVFQR